MCSRSLSSLRLTPSKSSGDGWDIFGVIIDRDILEEMLAKHYSDRTLNVEKENSTVIEIFLSQQYNSLLIVTFE